MITAPRQNGRLTANNRDSRASDFGKDKQMVTLHQKTNLIQILLVTSSHNTKKKGKPKPKQTICYQCQCVHRTKCSKITLCFPKIGTDYLSCIVAMATLINGLSCHRGLSTQNFSYLKGGKL